MLFNEETLIYEFAVEGQSHVKKIEMALLEFEKGQHDERLINEIFRAAHSIKGTAGFFGLPKIVELSHSMETLMGKIRDHGILIDEKIIDVLLDANDKLSEMLKNIKSSDEVDITLVMQKLLQMNSVESPSQSSEPTNHSKQGLQQWKQSDTLFHKIATSDSSEQYKADILALLKRGHKLYRVVLKHTGSVAEQKGIQQEISESIVSVGNIISSYIEQGSSVTSFDDEKEVNIIFLFSTVLEKQLVVLTLNMKEEDVIQLDDSIDKAEFSRILREGETIEAFHEVNVATHVDIPSPLVSDKNENHHDKHKESIRVNVDLLNDLVDLSGEMVLARNQLLRILDDHLDEVSGLSAVLQNMDYMTTKLQGKIMRTRMQTLANLFDVMPRVVRDLAKSMGKSVHLSIEGRSIEMDKTMIEELSDPLTHLLRNALDHGVETSEMRKQTGKPPIAEIIIKAYHAGGRVVIDIIDDGAGINLGTIKKKAVQRGLISKEQSHYMSAHELRNMIFLPGFSTSEEVTDISGRGVGLDIAKENIEQLGGTIEVYTVLGKGTTFRLILPLTLAIIPSLIVEVSDHNFALPQVNLQEIVRIVPGQQRKIEEVQGHMMLRLRGKLVPIVHLAEVLGLPLRHDWKLSMSRVLLLKSNTKIFGLIVDVIHEQEEILIKSIPRYLKGSKGYSGLTILGDGKVAMVLDTEGIATTAKLLLTEKHLQDLTVESMDIQSSMIEKQDLLLFKCSGSEIFGLHLSMISRVDEFDTRSIQIIGQNEYINFRGTMLRLIRLENYLPISKKTVTNHKQYVIIPKMTAAPIGIVIEKIQDTVEVVLHIHADGIKAHGLFGSTILQDRIILLLNLYELYELMIPGYALSNGRNQGEGKTLLVVEDTPFFAKMEQQYLEWAGYKVLLATNGQEALRILRHSHVDIVLSDLNMPIMNGITLVKTIRADEQLAKLPVIALVSSMANQEQDHLISEVGFDHYGCKFDRTDLLEKMLEVQSMGGGLFN